MSELPDDGLADPRLAAASSHAEVLAALAGARVFAGVVATATAEELGAHGLRTESSAEMAVLLLEADGERALPVFSSVPDLLAWRADARPVRLTGPQACRAALDEGARALVLDPAGTAVALALDELQALAEGWVPVPGSSLASRRGSTQLRPPAVPVPPDLVTALREALAGEPLRAARLLEGPEGLVLGVAGKGPLPPAALAALAHRVVSRLGPRLPAEGLDLAEVPARGPGVPVLRSRFGRRSW